MSRECFSRIPHPRCLEHLGQPQEYSEHNEAKELRSVLFGELDRLQILLKKNNVPVCLTGVFAARRKGFYTDKWRTVYPALICLSNPTLVTGFEANAAAKDYEHSDFVGLQNWCKQRSNEYGWPIESVGQALLERSLESCMIASCAKSVPSKNFFRMISALFSTPFGDSKEVLGTPRDFRRFVEYVGVLSTSSRFGNEHEVMYDFAKNQCFLIMESRPADVVGFTIETDKIFDPNKEDGKRQNFWRELVDKQKRLVYQKFLECLSDNENQILFSRSLTYAEQELLIEANGALWDEDQQSNLYRVIKNLESQKRQVEKSSAILKLISNIFSGANLETRNYMKKMLFDNASHVKWLWEITVSQPQSLTRNSVRHSNTLRGVWW